MELVLRDTVAEMQGLEGVKYPALLKNAKAKEVLQGSRMGVAASMTLAFTQALSWWGHSRPTRGRKCMCVHWLNLLGEDICGIKNPRTLLSSRQIYQINHFQQEIRTRCSS